LGVLETDYAIDVVGSSAAHFPKKCLDKYKSRRKSVAYWMRHVSLQDHYVCSIAWRDFPANFPYPCWNQTIKREWMKEWMNDFQSDVTLTVEKFVPKSTICNLCPELPKGLPSGRDDR
jgi:hypothetical protein